MGRKRSRKMERLLLYSACSITILIGALGCAYVSIGGHTTQGGLNKAASLAKDGDLTGALLQNQKLLKQYPSPLSEQALFQRGLLLSHPGNPEQNVKEAARVFEKLLTDFPDSGLAFEAGIWLKTLERLVQTEQAIDAVQKKIATQNRTVSQLKAQHAEGQKRIEKLVRQTTQLEGQIQKLESQIEKLKKVDLGIELEKRKTVSQ